MANERSKSIVGIFILITVLFIIFLIFAFYTVQNLKGGEGLRTGDHKMAPIGIVEVDGVIMDSRKTVEKLLKAEEDKSVKAIIVRVNSPGGAVGPTQEIYEEIRRINEVKPVYASFGSIAASGGYYIGAACRKIYSNAGAMTGSIGVIMNFMNLSKLYDWALVKPEIVKAGRYKDIGSPARDMTKEERKLLNEMTEKVHEQFINDIFKVRGERILNGLNGLKQYAQGQIFSGQGAKEKGLVDEIAGLWEAARRIHKELGIEAEFDMKYIKIKKDKISISDFIGEMEETVKDINYKLKSHSVPMFIQN